MTKEIELSQGKVALVDDGMYDELNCFRWFATKSKYTYYARRNKKENGVWTTSSMHRHILGLMCGDGDIADHINRNGLDNRRCNLRVVDYAHNSYNSNMRSNNKSGYMGVSWHKARKRWRAQIKIDDIDIHLGDYIEVLDAVEARKQGELKYW